MRWWIGCFLACSRVAESEPAELTMFHGDRARTGWNDRESTLTPDRVATSFGPAWSSPPFDSVEMNGRTYPGRAYATPLYVGGILYAATSNGHLYALDAAAHGAIVWKRQLGRPIFIPKLDGGSPLGILGTPVIDRGRIYVAVIDDVRFLVFALDARTGDTVPGYPVVLDDDALGAVNTNGPAKFFGPPHQSQRGALAISHDGTRLYVPFGAYYDQAPGWLAVIDVANAKLARAFSGAPSLRPEGNAGMWGAGGAAIDDDDRVWITTGNSPPESVGRRGVWGQSLLRFNGELRVEASYTAFNYCELEKNDIDLAGSSPMLLPALAGTSTPHVAVFGGKQGNIYLVDRDRLGNPHERRPCSTDASTDDSLLAPEVQPQFGTRGPLNVFGPYSEVYGNLDYAKMRSTLAYFRDRSGKHFVFASGSTKAAVDSPTSVAPSLAKLEVVTPAAQPAYLRVDTLEPTLVFQNPGAPVISSDGAEHAIVWVLDVNAPRTASLLEPTTPHPVLYAVDATTMKPLYRSGPRDLAIGGKYATPVIAKGMVFVGTDRLQAFGVR